MQVISNQKLKDLLAQDLVTILDVREHYEYQQGHIPESLWIPLNCITDCLDFFALDTPIVVICNTENRSAAACRFLAEAGFTHLSYAIPGMKHWDGNLVREDCPPLERGEIIKSQIYLDHAATTPVDPQVMSAMWWWLAQEFGNPSSTHLRGRKAKEALTKSRQQVACLLGSRENEIVFTSGGTEADSMALWGILGASSAKRRRLITSAIEHSAILENIKPLKRAGYDVTVLSVNNEGRVSPSVVRDALDTDVALVSIMYANNEVGTIEPIVELAKLAHDYGAYFHCDAVQAGGVCPLNVDELGVDALSLSAHKFYGPKGVGALYIRQEVPFVPTLFGGGQEGGYRAGTENIPGIVGFGVACRLAIQRLSQVGVLTQLRDYFLSELANIPGVCIYGSVEHRLPNNCYIGIPHGTGFQAVLDLDMAGIACSSGSACHGSRPSHVLQAMGVSMQAAEQGLRFSLGWKTTQTQVDQTLYELKRLLKKYA